jgi:cobalt-zinc-cadmium efflux system protein
MVRDMLGDIRCHGSRQSHGPTHVEGPGLRSGAFGVLGFGFLSGLARFMTGCTSSLAGVATSEATRASRERNLSQRHRLTILLGLNVAMIVGLVVVGFAAHSLGVLAAGGDYVADSTAIALGIFAVSVRDRVGDQSKAPTVVAAVNATALLIVSVIVAVEGVRRLVNGTPEIHGLPVLIVSAVATVVMVSGVFVLGTGAGSEDLHMRSVLLDTISDALAAAAVAVSGLVIYLTGRWFWLDSALSVLIAAVIAVGALRLLRDVIRSLRTGEPLDLDDD